MNSTDRVVWYRKIAKTWKASFWKWFSSIWELHKMLSSAETAKQTPLRWYIGKNAISANNYSFKLKFWKYLLFLEKIWSPRKNFENAKILVSFGQKKTKFGCFYGVLPKTGLRARFLIIWHPFFLYFLQKGLLKTPSKNGFLKSWHLCTARS